MIVESLSLRWEWSHYRWDDSWVTSIEMIVESLAFRCVQCCRRLSLVSHHGKCYEHLKGDNLLHDRLSLTAPGDKRLHRQWLLWGSRTYEYTGPCVCTFTCTCTCVCVYIVVYVFMCVYVPLCFGHSLIFSFKQGHNVTECQTPHQTTTNNDNFV